MSETEGFAEPDGFSALREALETAQAGEVPEDAPLPAEPAMDLLEAAWGIIANAGEGDWDSQRPEWREAAVRWRDRYHVMLRAFCEQYREPVPAATGQQRILPSYGHVLGQELGEAVYQALGAASVCWEPMDCTGVFQSERAKQIGHELIGIVVQFAQAYPRPGSTGYDPALHGGDPWADDRDDEADGEPEFLE